MNQRRRHATGKNLVIDKNWLKRKTRLKPLFRDLDAEIEKLERQYQHFKRKDDRFNYWFGCSHLHCHFDAYDEGYSSLAQYIEDNGQRAKEVALNVKLSADRGKRYTKIVGQKAKGRVVPQFTKGKRVRVVEQAKACKRVKYRSLAIDNVVCIGVEERVVINGMIIRNDKLHDSSTKHIERS